MRVFGRHGANPGEREWTSFALLERLGQEILDALFEDRRIESAEIALAKPGLLSGATPVVRLRARNR
jgi:dihydroneopterin aldolase